MILQTYLYTTEELPECSDLIRLVSKRDLAFNILSSSKSSELILDLRLLEG